jgi:hypothetical protein
VAAMLGGLCHSPGRLMEHAIAKATGQ